MNKFLLFIVPIVLLLWGCSSPQTRRDQAISMLMGLRGHDLVTSLDSEYASVYEAFSQAELQSGKDDAAADRYYQLTMLKAELYQRKVNESISKLARQRMAYHGKRKPMFPPTENARPLVFPEYVMTLLPKSHVKGGLVPRANWRFDGSDPSISTRLTFDDSFRYQVAGAEQVYLVQKGESLTLIGSKLGMSWRRLAKMNGLDPGKRLKPGQALRYDNRRIIPKTVKNGIIINIPDRTLYFFKEGTLVTAVPVAVGMSEKDGSIWQTPTGRFRILAKVENPAWTVPPSIKAEMEKDGKEVVEVVPPGATNPLGKYALRTSIPGILIHSTNLPASIYGFSSHGCIRVHPEHMEEFFHEVKVATRGEIIYEPVKVAVTDEGHVLLEVHPDIYRKSGDLREVVSRRLLPVQNRVSWNRVNEVLKGQRGVPEDVTLMPDTVPVKLAGT